MNKFNNLNAAYNEWDVEVLMEVESEDWADMAALARRILDKADGGSQRQLSFWGSDDPEERRWQ